MKPSLASPVRQPQGKNSPPHCQPQRTCIACGIENDKGELVRLVRTAQGKVELDLTGRKAGRGAYLCKAPACWEAGLKKNRLEHALRTKLSPQEREELAKYSRGLAS